MKETHCPFCHGYLLLLLSQCHHIMVDSLSPYISWRDLTRLYIYCQILLKARHVVSRDREHMFVLQNVALLRLTIGA